MENTSATNKRPTLYDPIEYATIKSIYFEDNATRNVDLDPIERLERMNSKQRNLNNNAR